MSVVDPFTTPGRWIVTTSSGARHLLDSRDPDAPVTVTRLTNAAPTAGDFARSTLRRDGAPVRVTAVQHVDPVHGRIEGFAVGTQMWLVLEPLRPDAAVTVRRTTPVVAIDSAPGDLCENRGSDQADG